MKSWIYEKRLEQFLDQSLKRYKKRGTKGGLFTRHSWAVLGFGAGWMAAIEELSKSKKTNDCREP